MDAARLLDEALAAWAYARAGVADEVENLPADRFGFRPAPESRSVAELARHVVQSGMMMAGELSRPDGDFARRSFEEHVADYGAVAEGVEGKNELLRLLRATHAEGERRIRAAGAEHMLGPIRQFDGTHASRLTWMHHGIGHEEYHRGQLALYARLQGLVPALTQRIRGG
ncbi:MAG TPA: DinB family protein [Longimicrobiaceae bacterium]|nr:DinB family protein [Longimicrobiaceae bacterium]